MFHSALDVVGPHVEVLQVVGVLPGVERPAGSARTGRRCPGGRRSARRTADCPSGSQASAPQPEPCTVVVAWVSWALNASNEPKSSSMAAASSPSGLPPPSGLRFSQKIEWRTWPDRLKARFFCRPDDGAEVLLRTRLGELVHRGVETVHVGLVVLVVVELEDLGRSSSVRGPRSRRAGRGACTST